MIRRLLSLLILAWLLGFAWFAIAMPRPLGNQKTDAIVVVTGGPGRIERGLAMLAQGQARQLFISGVDRGVTLADLARRYGHKDLFDCCVTLGFEAVDTRSNGIEVGRWVAQREYRSIRLITPDWHMRRARFELGRSMPRDAVVYIDAVRSEPTLGTLWNEYHKFLFTTIAAFVTWIMDKVGGGR